MKLKVDTADLRFGLYVSELDRPWLGTPFLFQGFLLQDADDLHQLQALCQHVFVDAERSEATALTQLKAATASKPTVPVTPAAGSAPDALSGDAKEYRVQLAHARELHHSTHDYVCQAMEDMRLGKSVDTPRAKKLIAELTRQVISNASALVWMTQLKNVDEYTSIHSLNVCILSLSFGRFLGMTEAELNVLGLGALLHDLGKMRVPLEVLNKPGRLTAQEFEIIKRHPLSGYELLERSKGLPDEALAIVRSHHERNDGSGYLERRQGGHIPRMVKVVSVVDVYDAITSDRVYHKGASPQTALDTIFKMAPGEFDQALVESFIQCIGIYPIGSLVELSTGEVGVLISQSAKGQLKPLVLALRAADGRMARPARLINLSSSVWGKDGAPRIARLLAPGMHGIDPVQVLRQQAGITAAVLSPNHA